MCRLFQYGATLLDHRLRREARRASWEARVGIFDRKGERLADAVAVGREFDPDDEEASLAAFYGASADAFRDAARSLFPFGAPYDERDRTGSPASIPGSVIGHRVEER
jgi:hypothetical protein